MASREERAKLRAQHQEKMNQMAKQPENHATFNSEIPTPEIEIKVEKKPAPEEKKVEKKPETKKVETRTTSKKSASTVEEKAKKKAEIKKTREEWYASKVKALEEYNDDKKSVKVIGKQEDITFWLKQSRKKGIAQQDYLSLIMLETIEAVKKGELTDESEEVLEYQKVLRDMGTPVNSRMSIKLLDEVKDAAAELCMKQTGFYAYSLKRARLQAEK